MYFKSDKIQFKECNRHLLEAVETDPEIRKRFTEEQLNDIKNGCTPREYTWHHSEQPGKMQLVDKEIHKRTGHTGGRAFWGGRSKYR